MSVIAPSAPSIITPGTGIESPYVSRMPRAYQSSDYEIIRRVRTRYQNAWTAKEWEIQQTIECWKFYFGAYGEQWDVDALRYKLERHQRAAQYNIIRDKVRTMLGMVASDEYEGRYDPITGERNSGVEALEFAYQCDKELMNYDDEYWQIVLDGLVHVGTMECRFSTDKDPLHGNIEFVRALPNRWITDPAWKTNNIYDCLMAWKQGHLSASQILSLNENTPLTPQMDVAIRKEKELGRDWSKPNLDEYQHAFPTMKDTYHVIEEHRIEEVKAERIIARRDDGVWVPFPVTEDNETLERFAMQNGIFDWQNGAQVVPYTDRVAYVDRMCWDLSPTKLIESGRPEIQIKCIPICQFTYDKDFSGRNMGMVNDAIDPQKDINYAKSKRQELMASAQGGGVIYNKQKMPNPDDQLDFESNSNDPTRAWGIDGDPSGFIQRVASSQYPQALVQESEEPFNIVDRILGVSAAMSSRTQGSNEPASLFAMKLKVNKVGTLALDKRVKAVRQWMYQSYFYQAQISYAGDERCFTSPSGKEKAVLNKRLPDGSIENKVDEIPLCSVTITESEGSLSRQLRDRAEISSMLQAIPKEYREPVAIMVAEAFKTMPLSPERKEMVEKSMLIEIAKARMASMTEISQMIAAGKGAKTQGLQADLVGIQLEQQLQGILNPVMNPQQQPQTPQMISRPAPGGQPAPGPQSRPQVPSPVQPTLNQMATQASPQ